MTERPVISDGPNWRGLQTLFMKEVRRFMNVVIQTVLAPVVTTLLYLLVFASALEGRVEVYDGISYLAFLVPGLIMMTILQNAFSNSSSSLIQSKMQGNLVFLLLSPISVTEIFIAFVGAAIVRGLMVGIGVWLVAAFFVDMSVHSVWMVLVFAILGSAILGAVGLVAGIWAAKYDQLAAFQNFIVLPLSFLSGVFYSIHSLPDFWQTISRFNPFLYMIDGFRFGFFGVSDINPWFSLLISGCFLVGIGVLCLALLRSGYKIRQ